jgi:hypothetical protein
MSTFRVGDKVRVSYAFLPENRIFVDREAIIIECRDFGYFGFGYGLDISPIKFNSETDGYACWNADQLEKILYEGSQPSEFKTVQELMDSLRGVAA